MDRRLASAELAKFFGVLSNSLRVQIIEELGERELTVNELQEAIGVAHASVSQHLGVLRSHRVVVERRQGRYVYYQLRQPQLAKIVRECLVYVSPDTTESDKLRQAYESASLKWNSSASEFKSSQT